MLRVLSDFKVPHIDLVRKQSIGGSRRRARRTPPGGPNSFVFTYIFMKSAHVRGPRPLLTGPRPLREIPDPPLQRVTISFKFNLFFSFILKFVSKSSIYEYTTARNKMAATCFSVCLSECSAEDYFSMLLWKI